MPPSRTVRADARSAFYGRAGSALAVELEMQGKGETPTPEVSTPTPERQATLG